MILSINKNMKENRINIPKSGVDDETRREVIDEAISYVKAELRLADAKGFLAQQMRAYGSEYVLKEAWQEVGDQQRYAFDEGSIGVEPFLQNLSLAEVDAVLSYLDDKSDRLMKVMESKTPEENDSFWQIYAHYDFARKFLRTIRNMQADLGRPEQ